MGAGASTSVKQITIDQTAQRNEERRRSGSGIASVGKKLRRSAESKSSADRRSEQLRHALEASEKRALDSEIRTRQLEREIASLEMRNSELAEEVTWLKQQLIDRPEVPIPTRPSSSSSKPTPTASELQQRLGAAEAKVKFYHDDSERQKQKLSAEIERYEGKIEQTRKEMGRSIVSLEQQIIELQRLVLHFEEALKKCLTDEEVEKLKTSAQLSASSKRRESIISGEKKPELIAELTEQIQNQRDKISRLEKELRHGVRTYDHTDSSTESNYPGFEEDAAAPHMAKPPMRPASTASRQSFTAVRKSSTSSPAPLKPERSQKGTENVEDEIEALLKSPDPLPTQADNPFEASTRSLPALGMGSGPVHHGSHENLPPPGPRHSSATPGPRKGSGVIRPRKPRSRQNSSLNNVYTLSESLEPMRVVDTPRKPGVPPLMRPQTADSVSRHHSKHSDPRRASEYTGPDAGDDDMAKKIVEEVKWSGEEGRSAHSAPMFFNKTSDPWPAEGTEGNPKRRNRKKNRHNLGDADLESISGDSPLPPEQHPAPKLSTESTGLRKIDSISSSLGTAGAETQDEGAATDSSDDEEVKRILEMRANVGDARTTLEGSSGVSHKLRGSISSQRYSSSARLSSGKSRDSGYLGDSYGLVNSKNGKSKEVAISKPFAET